MKLTLMITLAVLLTAASALAQPALMNVQGGLTNADGTPVADGPLNVTFRIYDVPAGGAALWAENQNVDVYRSIFNTILGYSNSLNGLPFDQIYYLGVQITGDPEMSPRIPLTSVPYAFNVVDGRVVKSLNGLTDQVNLVGGANISIVPMGQDLIINGVGGGADADWTIVGPDQYSAVPGNVGIGVSGPLEKLHVTNGNIGIGFPGVEFNYLNSYHPGGGLPSRFGGDHAGQGGEIEMYTESGDRYAFLEPDFNGEGGYLQVYGGAPDFGAFWVDGNTLGDGNPTVNIIGINSGTSFLTYESGDPSVNLPVDAVSAPEILDEVGAAASKQTFFVDINTTITTITNRTITCPTDGWVLALAQGEVELNHATGGFTFVRFGISTSNTFLPDGQDFGPEVPPSAASGTFLFPTSPHTVFPVSAGPTTFYVNADRGSNGTARVWETQLTLVFIPTMYGDISETPVAAKMSTDTVNDGTEAAPMNAGDISAERSASIQANQARIDAELAAMRAELAELKAQLVKANEAN